MQTTINIETAKEALANAEYAGALKELLFQLADDDFILAYRGSEWLGLAPHIEEDVAFCSMSQDMMGHAVMYYEMLEELGVGKADDLAQLREAKDFRNAILVERPNGTGEYNDNPRYDWAYAVVRHYLYGIFKQVRLESLMNSSYAPLRYGAQKILTEHQYHMIHWNVWMKQLSGSTDEARKRILQAIDKAWADVAGLFSLGGSAVEIVKHGLVEGEELLAQRWTERVKQGFESMNLPWPGKPEAPELDGRKGQHTDDLVRALATLSEVYRIDPAAGW